MGKRAEMNIQNSPEHSANSLGDVLARVGGLTSGNSDHFDTSVREGRVNERGPETGEATSVAGTDVFLHRTLFPVPETATIMVRRTAEHNDKRDDEQAQDSDDLDTGEDELGFSVDTHSEDIQGDDDDDDDGDPDGGVDLLLSIPERDENGSSRNFGA